jgi:Domain of unknown function (DUF4258)
MVGCQRFIRAHEARWASDPIARGAATFVHCGPWPKQRSATHAAEELEDDNLSILDLENIVLTGQVKERQRDVHTREVKYVVEGFTLDGSAADVVLKVGFGGRLIVVTVYLC